MPSLKTIRKRIASVKSTQKITRAMKMVAAARLRRAQQRITEMRPFALKTAAIIHSVASRIDSAGDGDSQHPLLAVREERSVILVVVSSDRGLAGAFNSNVNRAAERRMKELQAEGKRVALVTIGRKARDYFRRRGTEILKEIPGVNEKIDIARADEIAAEIVDIYIGHKPNNADVMGAAGESHEPVTDEGRSILEQRFDSVHLIFNEFKSAMTQVARIQRLLPMVDDVPAGRESAVADGGEYLYEPSRSALLDTLLPLYVQVTVLRALLESVASFFGAQMTAMDSATNNAKEMIGKLTLDYNRARQAAITKELMEIISGSEALK
jgi:F-type H+-transporting ATPase subunit gamma